MTFGRVVPDVSKDRTAFIFLDYFTLNVKALLILPGKGKAIPLQAWTGPEDSRRLRLPDFKTIGP
jgi:hypothetical protein